MKKRSKRLKIKQINKSDNFTRSNREKAYIIKIDKLINAVDVSSLLPGIVDENIIATTKIRNNYGAIQSFKFPIYY